jgi:hypothetical protein
MPGGPNWRPGRQQVENPLRSEPVLNVLRRAAWNCRAHSADSRSTCSIIEPRLLRFPAITVPVYLVSRDPSLSSAVAARNPAHASSRSSHARFEGYQSPRFSDDPAQDVPHP